MIIFVSERQSQNMIILGRSLPSGKCDWVNDMQKT
jgi:hypothetical protein